jgi:uncharacterized membrane protein YccC
VAAGCLVEPLLKVLKLVPFVVEAYVACAIGMVLVTLVAVVSEFLIVVVIVIVVIFGALGQRSRVVASLDG